MFGISVIEPLKLLSGMAVEMDFLGERICFEDPLYAIE